MTLDRWDDTANITYDRAIWNELCSLRFVDAGHNAVIMGPVGVGKTFLATALGHAAVRRRHSVHFERGDRLLKRLRATRLDNSHDTEIRKLLRVDLLIIDDFALQALDAIDTADVYELIVERHRRRRHHRHLQPGTRRMARPRWPTRSSPSPPSTGSSPPPTNSSSTASPTGNAKDPASPPALDDPGPPTIIPTPTLTDPGPGPMPLANRWSHHAGERQRSCEGDSG